MRTTVDLDEDLLQRLRDLATRKHVSFKHLLNRVIRRGLESPPGSAVKRYRCPSFAMGSPAPGVDLDKAVSVASALEETEVARKLDARK